MSLHIIHALLKCIYKPLNHFRILIQIALLRWKCSVWHIAAICTERCYYIALALRLQCSRTWFKFHSIIIFWLIPRKCCCSRSKIDALINIYFRWFNAILTQNILKYHLRHTTFSSADYILTFQVFPFKIWFIVSCHKEIAGPLSKLCKIHHIIFRTLIVGINGRLRTHKTDICFPGDYCSHRLVSSKRG